MGVESSKSKAEYMTALKKHIWDWKVDNPVSMDWVSRVISSVFSEAPIGIQEIIGKGGQNAVFSVDIPEVGELIFRTRCRRNLSSYMREQWGMRLAKGVGVPVAEVVATGEIDDIAYSIQTRVPGTTADEYPGDRLSVWYQLGSYAKRLHSVSTSKHCIDLTKWVDESIPALFRDNSLFDHEVISPSEANGVKERLVSMSQWKFEPGLVFGDFALRNTIVDEVGNITAIIDWGLTGSCYVPQFELGSTFANTSQDEKEAFLEGYGISQAAFLNLRYEVDTIKLLHLLSRARRRIREGEMKRLRRTLRKIRSMLDLDT